MIEFVIVLMSGIWLGRVIGKLEGKRQATAKIPTGWTGPQ